MFCLMILFWNIQKLRSFRYIQLLSYLYDIRKTYTYKRKLKEVLRYFILRILESFSKVLMAFATNIKALYSTVKIKRKGFYSFDFFRNGIVIFNGYYFFYLSYFSNETWFYYFPERFVIGNLIYVEVTVELRFRLFKKLRERSTVTQV